MSKNEEAFVIFIYVLVISRISADAYDLKKRGAFASIKL